MTRKCLRTLRTERDPSILLRFSSHSIYNSPQSHPTMPNHYRPSSLSFFIDSPSPATSYLPVTLVLYTVAPVALLEWEIGKRWCYGSGDCRNMNMERSAHLRILSLICSPESCWSIRRRRRWGNEPWAAFMMRATFLRDSSTASD